MSKSILKILQNVTNIFWSMHVDFLILDAAEYGEHDDHVHHHPMSQRQHGFGRKLPQRTSTKILG